MEIESLQSSNLPILESLMELFDNFHSEAQCIQLLEQAIWNGNPVSPFDPDSKIYKCKNRRYKCKNSNKYFNVRHGTIFYNSPIKLTKWFMAIWLITVEKKGISSLQLRRHLKVSKQTAWFMLHRIRNCFAIDSNDKLSNEVEVDETYVGGHTRNKSISKRKEIHKEGVQTGSKGKVPVLGMLERGGKVKCKVLKKAQGKTIKPVLNEYINKSAHVITDGFGAYNGINKNFSDHSIINHNLGEYVNGRIHTNTIEGFWSLFKRGIIGTYHSTSEKHLPKYVDESVFRYNTRSLEDGERFNLALINCKHPLTFQELLAA